MSYLFVRRALCVALACLTLGGSLVGCVDAVDDSKDNTEEESMTSDPAQQAYLILANKTQVLGASYTPATLTDLDPSLTVGGKAIRLEATAAEAVAELIAAIRRAGYNDVAVTSGYRTYDYQKTLFNRYMEQERTKPANAGKTDKEIEAIVLTYSAKPGTSEHQTGLCVDLFDTAQMLELENYGHEGVYSHDVGFAETKAFAWLKANAHRYGFILRYPEDKVAITGYQYESWHYRYVGVEAAADIWARGITLEEYLTGK